MAKIVLSVKDEFSRTLNAYTSDMDKATDASGAFASGANKMGQANKTAGLSLTDLKSGLDLASQGLHLIQQGFDATVAKAANWGDEMGDMAQLTGQSVREMSKMAATMELVGIDAGTLKRVLKTMTAEGLNLNMETLMKLNKEYQAIQDPVKRNEFLFKNFGKSAADMAEIMGRSTEELMELTAAAEQSGKVIDEKTAEAAEKLNVQLAILKQRADGAAIEIGNRVIPALLDWDKAALHMNDRLAENYGVLVPLNPEYRENAIVMNAAADAATVTADEMNASATAIYNLTSASNGATNAARTMGGAIMSDWYTPAITYKDTALLAAQAAERLNAANAAAAGPGAEMAGALEAAGVKGQDYLTALMGIDKILGTSMATDQRKRDAVAEISAEYAKTGDIDTYIKKMQQLYMTDLPAAQTKFSDAAAAAGYLADKYQMILDKPDIQKNITVTTNYTSSGNAGGSGAQGNQQFGFAVGGAVAAGRPTKLHKDEIFVPQTGGYVMTKQEAQAAMSFGNINVDARGSTLSAAAIKAAVKAALDEAGRSSDAYRRTGGVN